MVHAVLIALAFFAAEPTVRAAPAPAPVVFFDIAGPDAATQTAFYRDVFGWRSGPGGMLSVPISGSVLSGALRQDPASKIIYIGVDDVAGCLAQVEAHGGKIVHPRFEVKGVVVLGLFTDPAGNGMGLVEMQGGKPKVP
jgi:predicted enzyme related to lactoylglutathione lyase